MNTFPPTKFLASLFCAALSFSLCGCGLTGTALPSGPASQVVQGRAVGGHGPIGGSSVKLYLAGTSGYGSASTLLASTTTSTDHQGTFSIDPNSYTCPAGGQVYVVTRGGDPQGTTGASNPAIALTASLGTCGSLAGFTDITEASTVITTYAAAQFFNATTESFGSPATPQAVQGLVNAFQLAEAIVPPASGSVVASYQPSSSISGVTMKATPETAKINSLADILAACVNSTNTAAAAAGSCTDLFNAAIGLPEASATSGSTLSSGSFPAATDTLMAAYYLATNPALLTAVTPSQTQNTTSNCNSGGGAVSSNTCLFNMIAGSGAPFTPTLASAPLDWTVSVAYSATGTCSNTGAPTTSTWHGAVDAMGNVWVMNDSVTGTASKTQGNYSVLSEFGPTGSLQQCLGGNLSGGQGAAGRDVAIDTAGNIWASTQGGSVYATSSSSSSTSYRNHVYQYIPSTSTFNVESVPAAGLNLYYMSADGLGNVYVTSESTGGALYEFPNAVASTDGNATFNAVGSSPLITSATATQTLYGIQADSNNNIWLGNQGSTTDVVYTPTTGTSTNFTGITQVGPYNLIIDANNNLVIANTCCASANANKAVKMSPNSTTAPTGVNSTTVAVSAQYAGGLSTARSLAVDGANNLWASSAIATDASGDFNIVELDSALNGLSPTGTPTGTCPSVTCLTNGGYAKPTLSVSRGLAIDGSGDVWVFSSTGSSITELIGAAVPVVTPLSNATKYGLIGKKPTNLIYTLPAQTETAGAAYSATAVFGANTPTPTGTLTFTPVGTGAPTCTISSATTPFTGTVTCASANSTLAAKTYTVKFTYSGDSNYSAATGTTTLTVQ